MKTILHFIGSLEVGGTENMLLAYLKSTKSKELRHIVCTIYPRGPLQEEFRKAGIEVISLGLGSKLAYPLAFIKFSGVVKKTNPDIVHSYLLQENLVARVVCKLMGKRLICGKRDTDRGKPFWKVWLDRLTLPLAGLNISNSIAGKKELISYGVPVNRVIAIPNGKDISPFNIALSKKEAKERLGFKEHNVLLGCVARLYKFKGHEYLIRAMPEILAKNSNAGLLVVGEGEMRPKLEALVKELRLGGTVNFLGERKDVPEILNGLDIFILPSLREGMPGALMEAMASGLPVVATDIDGNNELVDGEKNGILIPPADSGAISKAVLSLLGDRKRMESIGRMARKEIEDNYIIGKMAESLDKAYLAF